MSTHITSVTLSTEVDEHGRPVWRVNWTESSNSRTWTKTHHNPTAANRHTAGLLAKRPPGTTIADVYTDNTGQVGQRSVD